MEKSWKVAPRFGPGGMEQVSHHPGWVVPPLRALEAVRAAEMPEFERDRVLGLRTVKNGPVTGMSYEINYLGEVVMGGRPYGKESVDLMVEAYPEIVRRPAPWRGVEWKSYCHPNRRHVCEIYWYLPGHTEWEVSSVGWARVVEVDDVRERCRMDTGRWYPNNRLGLEVGEVVMKSMMLARGSGWQRIDSGWEVVFNHGAEEWPIKIRGGRWDGWRVVVFGDYSRFWVPWGIEVAGPWVRAVVVGTDKYIMATRSEMEGILLVKKESLKRPLKKDGVDLVRLENGRVMEQAEFDEWANVDGVYINGEDLGW